MHHEPLSGLSSLCDTHFIITFYYILFCELARKGWKKTIFWAYLVHLRNVSFLECGSVLARELTKDIF